MLGMDLGCIVSGKQVALLLLAAAGLAALGEFLSFVR